MKVRFCMVALALSAALAFGSVSPSFATTTTKAKAAKPVKKPSGFGTWAFSYAGATGTVEVPTPASDPDVADVESFRNDAEEPPVTYVVATINNMKGSKTLKMYQVVVVTKNGNQINVGDVDDLVGNWQDDLDPSSDNYNESTEVYNDNLSEPLLPGAKGIAILATQETFNSVARVYVYPYGGFATVEAKKVG